MTSKLARIDTNNTHDKTTLVISGKATLVLPPGAPLVQPGERVEFRCQQPRHEYTDEERTRILNPTPSLGQEATQKHTED